MGPIPIRLPFFPDLTLSRATLFGRWAFRAGRLSFVACLAIHSAAVFAALRSGGLLPGASFAAASRTRPVTVEWIEITAVPVVEGEETGLPAILPDTETVRSLAALSLAGEGKKAGTLEEAAEMAKGVRGSSVEEIARILSSGHEGEYIPTDPPPPGPFDWQQMRPYAWTEIKDEKGSTGLRVTYVDREGRTTVQELFGEQAEAMRPYTRLMDTIGRNDALRALTESILPRLVEETNRRSRLPAPVKEKEPAATEAQP